MNEPTKATESAAPMIPIWFWVGLVLTVYGVIVTGMGIYYAAVPETKTATASLNPSLWWGIFMVAVGALFLALGRRVRKQEQRKTG